MKQLLVYLKDYKKECVFAPLFKMLEASFELIVPLVTAQIIDVGIRRQDAVFVWKMGFVMVALGLVVLLSKTLTRNTVRLLFRVRIEQKVEREQVAKVTGTNKDDTLQKGPVKRAEAKVYPNDPCPCGSGKKYKQCCGRK